LLTLCLQAHQAFQEASITRERAAQQQLAHLTEQMKQTQNMLSMLQQQRAQQQESNGQLSTEVIPSQSTR
jgi:hypothetical protein